MKILAAVTALFLFFAVGAAAETTNPLSDAEIQGQQLAQKILDQWPAENFTNTGVLKIKAAGRRAEVPVKFEVNVSATNWQNRYEAGAVWLATTHGAGAANDYLYHAEAGPAVSLSGSQLMVPFADSDFWLADLGLEFFHWPQQKVLKKEFHRQCGCTVLESTNPNPSTNGYSRVVSWVDSESLGLVEAYAYDVNGRKLKNFYPKDLQKVNGRYQVQTLVMENLQTDSRSRLEFDLKK